MTSVLSGHPSPECQHHPCTRRFQGGRSCLPLTLWTAEFVGTPAYLDGGTAVVFLGTEDLASLAVSVFVEARATIVQLAKQRYGGAAKGHGGMFALGFVRGLHEKLKEADATLSKTEGALVVQTKELIQKRATEARAWLAEQGVQIAPARVAANYSSHRGVFNDGVAAGRQYSATRQRKMA